jgi:hypothetical protein
MNQDDYFFCGIGGSGMLPLAMIVQARVRASGGGRIEGSDRSRDQGRTPEKFAWLEAHGVILHPQDGSGVTRPEQTVVATGSIEDTVDYSWNVLANYAFTADFSSAVRVTGSEGFQGTNDTFGYGVASTYVLHKNFSLKAEVTKTENNSFVSGNGSNSDVFSYALQGVLRF